MYVLCTISELGFFIRGPPKATGHSLGWLRCTSQHVHWFRSVVQGPWDPTGRFFGGRGARTCQKQGILGELAVSCGGSPVLVSVAVVSCVLFLLRGGIYKTPPSISQISTLRTNYLRATMALQGLLRMPNRIPYFQHFPSSQRKIIAPLR